ncbi:hypothetical protein MTQ01_10250 [Streptomyces sp. XM4193]|uniref:hypothetical protein n=1 Tax=Streptomyces sp. XM4193 TaxID=2929782 RepID=UPI001FF98BBE|nr:hypothetical protein [Streptomyces sp. XM4193]MCK1796381.1 hypothetical protein [Streptomyces sp. XM4193]
MNRGTRRTATVCALGAALLGALSAPAHSAPAKRDVTVRTSDSAGSATFVHHGDSLRVCDLKADGRRVVGRLLWTDLKGSHHTLTEDSNGAGNSCARQSFDIPEGTPVTIKVCLKKGPKGIQEKCALERAVA